MNTALFYFYLAGVVDGASDALLVLSMTVTLAFVVMGIAGMIQRSDYDNTTIHDKMLPQVWKGATVVSLAVFLIVLTPSKEFFYTLAGLEAAEVAVETELGQKAVELITQQIDNLLEVPE